MMRGTLHTHWQRSRIAAWRVRSAAVGRVWRGAVRAILRYAVIGVSHGRAHYPSDDSETPFTANSHSPRAAVASSTDQWRGRSLRDLPRRAQQLEGGGTAFTQGTVLPTIGRHYPLRLEGRKCHTRRGQ